MVRMLSLLIILVLPNVFAPLVAPVHHAARVWSARELGAPVVAPADALHRAVAPADDAAPIAPEPRR
jgi:hypothetical protein